MSSRSFTGWFLVLGPLVALAFFAFGPLGVTSGLGSDPTNSDKLTVLARNVDWAQAASGITLLGLLTATIGWAGIKTSMSGGDGAPYAEAGFWVLLIAAAGWAASATLFGAAAEAAATEGAEVVAASLMAAQDAFSSATGQLSAIALVLFGVGILIQKNFPQLLAGALVAVGIITFVVVSMDLSPTILLIVYLLQTITIVLTGGLVLRSSK